MKKNILMFVSNGVTWDPRVRNEAASLLKRGFQVNIIGWDRTNKLRTDERLDEIKAHRVRNSTFMKMLPYDIFRLPFWRQSAFRKGKEIHRETPIVRHGSLVSTFFE